MSAVSSRPVFYAVGIINLINNLTVILAGISLFFLSLSLVSLTFLEPSQSGKLFLGYMNATYAPINIWLKPLLALINWLSLGLGISFLFKGLRDRVRGV